MVWLLACRCVAGETATAVATVTAGFVTGITVTSGGSGYVSEPAVTLSGGGGSGATAKVILSGDKVAQIVVLTAGSGYTTSPTVTVEGPPKPLGVKLEMVPKLTVEGPVGRLAEVEWALDLAGPWTMWTNVLVGAEGTVLVDLTPGAVGRLYRAVVDPRPVRADGFVWIPQGTFQMGSTLGTDPDKSDNEISHTVTLTHGFWMLDHEVTQAEYQSVTGLTPSMYRGDSSRPVEQVSWEDAVSYCQKLTIRERAAGRIKAQQVYRLPTEAEWEYAARAGTTAERYGELDAIAWWYINSVESSRPVKGKQPNAWGLYDMLGNVWEWCGDWYGDYPTGSVTDPTGSSSGSFRVLRGGCYSSLSRLLRSAFRSWGGPGARDSTIGFRVVLSDVTAQPLILPTIKVQPQSVTVAAGQNAILSVIAEGAGTLSYQWLRNGSVIIGGNQATLSFANAQIADEGDYSVVVSNAGGSITSAGARLTVNSVPQSPAGFVWIAPGTFVMGSPETETGREWDEIQHTVTLTRGFWFCDHEVTQAEYQSVTGLTPSFFGGISSRPVEQVSWDDAVAYCQKLTKQEQAAGRITLQQIYRLPTEAEWEFAARAGTAGRRYSDGWVVDPIAWWNLNASGQTHLVRQKTPNAWGLYDMMGNVNEWCADWYGQYPNSGVTDPLGPQTGTLRVFRGGFWGSKKEDYVRSAFRSSGQPSTRVNTTGFRVVMSLVP